MFSTLHIRLTQCVSLLLLCAASTAFADTTVYVPHPYSIYLVDGQNHKGLDPELHFAAGEHQMVIRYEGNFGNKENIRVVSGEPMVINFNTNGNEQLKIDLPMLHDANQARQFLANQKLQLVDSNTKAVKTATIFELPKKEGLQIGRDYQEELIAQGKAFQQPIINSDGTVSAATSGAAVAGPAAGLNNKNLQSLEMLKYWYNRSDVPTRKAFQVWIVNQQ